MSSTCDPLPSSPHRFCLFCCFSFEPNANDKQSAHSSSSRTLQKFFQGLQDHHLHLQQVDSLQKNVFGIGSSFLKQEKLSVCPDCLASVSSAVDVWEEAKAVEARVNRLQRQLLGEMRRLGKHMDQFSAALGKMELAVKGSDESWLEMMEEELHLEKEKRDGISWLRRRILLDLQSYRFSLQQKFPHGVSHEHATPKSSEQSQPKRRSVRIVRTKSQVDKTAKRPRKLEKSPNVSPVKWKPEPPENELDNPFLDDANITSSDEFMRSTLNGEDDVSDTTTTYAAASNKFSPKRSTFTELNTLLEDPSNGEDEGADSDGCDDNYLPSNRSNSESPHEDSDSDSDWMENDSSLNPSDKQKNRIVIKSVKSLSSLLASHPHRDKLEATTMSPLRLQLILAAHRREQKRLQLLARRGRDADDNSNSNDFDEFCWYRNKFPVEYRPTTDLIYLGGVGFGLSEDESMIICSACPYTVPIGEITKKSQRLHRKERLIYRHILAKHLDAFKCGICMKIYGSDWKFTTHMKCHSPAESAKFKCEICGRTLSSVDTLNAHRLTHMNAEEKEEAIANGVLGVRRLNRKKEAGCFCCDLCGKILKHKRDLEVHVQTHEGDRETTVCSKCGKSMLRASYETYHSKYVCPERELSKVSCTEPGCSKTFKNRRFLKVHLARIHSEEGKNKSIQCGTCGMRFSHRENLRLHEELHNDIVKYFCGCGKSFAVRRYFRRHELSCGKKMASKMTPKTPKNVSESTGKRKQVGGGGGGGGPASGGRRRSTGHRKKSAKVDEDPLACVKTELLR